MQCQREGSRGMTQPPTVILQMRKQRRSGWSRPRLRENTRFCFVSAPLAGPFPAVLEMAVTAVTAPPQCRPLPGSLLGSLPLQRIGSCH